MERRLGKGLLAPLSTFFQSTRLLLTSKGTIAKEAARIIGCWLMMQTKLLSLMSRFIRMEAIKDAVLRFMAHVLEMNSSRAKQISLL